MMEGVWVMGMLQKSERAGVEKHNWTLEEDKILLAMKEEGFSAGAIAKRLQTHKVLSVRYRLGWHTKAENPSTMEALEAYHKALAAKRSGQKGEDKGGAMVQ